MKTTSTTVLDDDDQENDQKDDQILCSISFLPLLGIHFARGAAESARSDTARNDLLGVICCLAASRAHGERLAGERLCCRPADSFVLPARRAKRAS